MRLSGLVSRLVSADGTSQSMEYDRRVRRLSHIDPSTGTTTREYNALGELARRPMATATSPSIETMCSVASGRSFPRTDKKSIYKWDTASTGIGKPVNTTSADGVGISYRYDSIGRPSSVRWNVEGVQYELAYGYDEIGRLDRITYPAIPGAPAPTGRLTLDYVYNPQGYLSQSRTPSQTSRPTGRSTSAMSPASSHKRPSETARRADMSTTTRPGS